MFHSNFYRVIYHWEDLFIRKITLKLGPYDTRASVGYTHENFTIVFILTLLLRHRITQ